MSPIPEHLYQKVSLGVTILFVILGGVTPGFSADKIILGFESEKQFLDRWREITFSGRRSTQYRFNNNLKAVCAKAQSSASGLARTVDVSDTEFVLEWEWEIHGTIPGGNARKKKGDDYSARVYVNFERSEPWSWWEQVKVSTYETFSGQEVPGTSLNFIWANRIPRYEVVRSPYTNRARLVAVRSGSDSTGRWVKERMNVAKWYRRAFQQTVPDVQSVAIMTDSDNTGTETTACYRDIVVTGIDSR